MVQFQDFQASPPGHFSAFFAELSISGENGAMSELFQHSRSLYTGRVVLDQQ